MYKNNFYSINDSDKYKIGYYISHHLPIINLYIYICLSCYSNFQYRLLQSHPKKSLSCIFEILKRSIWEDSESKCKLRQSCVLLFSNRSLFWYRSLWYSLLHFISFILWCWKIKRKRLEEAARATRESYKSNISLFDEGLSQNIQYLEMRHWSKGSRTDDEEV